MAVATVAAAMATAPKPRIQNPVLRGFHPDPSILRVGDDYYIATSTFEWFPGVEIHHSRDLIHWRLLTRPLDRASQLDLLEAPNSGGVWAPCLSFDGGLFYLCYTNVRRIDFPQLSTPNFLVTARNIEGPWSDPVELNKSGFDPSLFHDEDGRKWLLNMRWDPSRKDNPFGGILLQEYSAKERRLVGPIRNVFAGTHLGVTEGPHLYKHGGWYYLITAEGGTSYYHAVSVARSRALVGPYDVDPENPVLSSRGRPDVPLQKAGHASLVETQNGEWYLAHLCGRPLARLGRCVLGRETAIQKVFWTDDGWLRLDGGGRLPRLRVPAPSLPACPWPAPAARNDFNSAMLDSQFQTLRFPPGGDSLSLTERPGWLRLKGREPLSSTKRQAFVARRQQAFSYAATTCLEFEPENERQSAGLVCFYDTEHYFYLYVTRKPGVGKCAAIESADKGRLETPARSEASIEGWPRCFLRAEVLRDELKFSISRDGLSWQRIGPVLDASKLSDEYCHPILAFTGAFVGLCAQDATGAGRHADFDFFEYVEHDAGPEETAS